MLNLSNKRFTEIVFDFLNDNLSEQQKEEFRETVRIEWDGDHRCINFYTSEDADEPEYRLFCTKARVNPAKL